MSKPPSIIAFMSRLEAAVSNWAKNGRTAGAMSRGCFLTGVVFLARIRTEHE